MDAHGYTECMPKRPDGLTGEESAVTLASGYVERARASLPRQGSRMPWRTFNNYFRVLMIMRFGGVNDGVLQFSRAGQQALAAVVAGGLR
jgi:hypothetical protein